MKYFELTTTTKTATYTQKIKYNIYKMVVTCEPSSMELYAFRRINVIIKRKLYVCTEWMEHAMFIFYCVVLEFTLNIPNWIYSLTKRGGSTFFFFIRIQHFDSIIKRHWIATSFWCQTHLVNEEMANKWLNIICHSGSCEFSVELHENRCMYSFFEMESAEVLTIFIWKRWLVFATAILGWTSFEIHADDGQEQSLNGLILVSIFVTKAPISCLLNTWHEPVANEHGRHGKHFPLESAKKQIEHVRCRPSIQLDVKYAIVQSLTSRNSNVPEEYGEWPFPKTSLPMWYHLLLFRLTSHCVGNAIVCACAYDN